MAAAAEASAEEENPLSEDEADDGVELEEDEVLSVSIDGEDGAEADGE